MPATKLPSIPNFCLKIKHATCKCRHGIKTARMQAQYDIAFVLHAAETGRSIGVAVYVTRKSYMASIVEHRPPAKILHL